MLLQAFENQVCLGEIGFVHGLKQLPPAFVLFNVLPENNAEYATVYFCWDNAVDCMQVIFYWSYITRQICCSFDTKQHLRPALPTGGGSGLEHRITLSSAQEDQVSQNSAQQSTILTCWGLWYFKMWWQALKKAGHLIFCPLNLFFIVADTRDL